MRKSLKNKLNIVVMIIVKLWSCLFYNKINMHIKGENSEP